MLPSLIDLPTRGRNGLPLVLRVSGYSRNPSIIDTLATLDILVHYPLYIFITLQSIRLNYHTF